MDRRRLGMAMGAAALAALLAATPATAAPLGMDDAPTWDQVQAARADQASTEAMIASIAAVLDELQAEATRLGDVAVTSAAEASQAEQARLSAQAAADRLTEQADRAAERADASAAAAAAAVSALVRSSGPDLELALLASDDDLLGRLGMLDRVGGMLDAVLQTALVDRNTAASLAEQADQAEALLASAADQARAAADSAAASAAEAQSLAAAQQSRLGELYAQLATLKATTAEQERLYRIGQQNGGSSGGGDGGGDGGGSYGLGSVGSEYNDPAGAQAYAWSLFPSFGWGSPEPWYQWCLTALWNRESGWRTNAYNASSGAYGIPQSLPGNKMAAVGADWATNYQTQVLWGLYYIQGRYGTPCEAWAKSEAVGWY